MKVRASRAARPAGGVRYGTDREPGLRRIRRGSGFRYEDAGGRRVTNAAVLARIRALAIPPAWTEVRICASPRAHLQASGRDARRRKQYRYHAEWMALRSETEFDRLLAFGPAPPQGPGRAGATPRVLADLDRLRRVRAHQ